MGFLRRLLGGGDPAGDAAPGDGGPDSTASAPLLEASEAAFELHAQRHRVTVWLALADPGFENEREQVRVFALENAIMAVLDRSGAGEHDTNSLEPGYLGLRLVGNDADAIIAEVMPLLRDAPPRSYLAVRRGPAGAAEERLDLEAPS